MYSIFSNLTGQYLVLFYLGSIFIPFPVNVNKLQLAPLRKKVGELIDINRNFLKYLTLQALSVVSPMGVSLDNIFWYFFVIYYLTYCNSVYNYAVLRKVQVNSYINLRPFFT